MHPIFYFQVIGDAVAEELRQRIDRGESAIIHGPKGVGKRYLIALLNELLIKLGRSPMPMAEFGAEHLITQEKEAAQALARASGFADGITTFEKWAEQIRAAFTREQPLRLVVTNADGMSIALAQRFLIQVRTLVTVDQCLIIVITGEVNLLDMVDGGPNSAFACAHQYVVHAHDLKHFKLILAKQMAQNNLQFAEGKDEEIVQRLYAVTGGNVCLLRLTLWCVMDWENQYFRDPAHLPVILTLDRIPKKLTQTRAVSVGGLAPFQHAVQSVFAATVGPKGSDGTREVEVLDMLRKLLRGEPNISISGEPHTLELCGLACRDAQGHLVWASGYAKSFSAAWFTQQRLGDYYAFAHRWDRAMECYRQIEPPEEKFRPRSDEDHAVLMRVLDGRAVVFHQWVSEAFSRKDLSSLLSKLRNGLLESLVDILGFSLGDISCWSPDYLGVWHPHEDYKHNETAPPILLQRWKEIWQRDKIDETELCGHEAGYHWVLCRNKAGKVTLAVLINDSSNLAHHSLRKSAVERLLRGYRHARERYLVYHELNAEIARQKAELEISRNLWNIPESSTWDLKGILKSIATPLLKHLASVQRLIFCELKETRGQILIKPIYDSRTTKEVADGRVTVLPLMHSEIILKGNKLKGHKLYLGREAANEAFLEIAGEAKFTSDTILLANEKCTHAVILEGNGAFLSAADIEPLLELAQRLEAEWDLAFRLVVLYESLHAFHTPTVLLDSERRIIFANQHAIEKLFLVGVKAGWQAEPVDIAKFGAKVAAALTPPENAKVRQLKSLTEQMPGTWFVECQPIDNLKGWVLTYRDRAFLFGAFKLIKQIEAAKNEAAALMLMAQSIRDLLGAPSAQLRIYTFDKNRPYLLVSQCAVGMSKANAKSFAAGGVSFLRGRNAVSWACFERRRPAIFKLSFFEEEGFGMTEKGLSYQRVNSSQFQNELGKKNGDLWIDLPLLSGDQWLGKLTLAFSEEDANKLSPDTPMLFGALSVLLAGLLERINQESTREERIKGEAYAAMAETAHNLLGEISAFAPILVNYRLLARDHQIPKLGQLNERMERFYADAQQSLRRIHERAGMGPVQLEPREHNLIEIISRALGTALFNDTWEWEEGSVTEVPGMWDEMHWRFVFMELASNSRDFARPGIPLEIRVGAKWVETETSRTLALSYRDNGRGVPAAYKKEIFDGKSHREVLGKRGNGRGMNYTKRVIAAHGGSIVEQGIENEGVHMVITIPKSYDLNPKELL